MKRLLPLLLVLVSVLCTPALLAQDDSCSAEGIEERIDALIEEYSTGSDDTDSALEQAQILRDGIDEILEDCADATAVSESNTVE